MKLSVSSATMLELPTGEYTGDSQHQAAILLDDGSIWANVDPPFDKNQKLVYAGPNLPSVVDIAISAAGLFALTKDGHIYQYRIGAISELGQWQKNAAAKDVVGIANDGEGGIWCINKKGELYRAYRVPESGVLSDWQRVDAVNATQKNARKLAVSSNRSLDLSTGKLFGPFHHGVAILSDTGHIYVDYNADTAPNGYSPADTMVHAHGEPANVVDIAMSGRAGLFAYDKAGDVYYYMQRGEGGDWIRNEDTKDVIGLGSDSDGDIWVLNKKGEVYQAAPELPAGVSEWRRVTAVNTAPFWSATWEYTVKPKDGLFQIIRTNYGVSDQPTLQHISAEIARLNKLANENRISAGQVLVMPAKTYR